MNKLILIAIAGLAGSNLGCNKPDAPGGSGTTASTAPATAGKRLDFPGTADGAKAMLGGLLKAGADQAALSKQLRPDPADYKAVFEGDAAEKVQKAMDPPWDGGQVVVKNNPGQTEVRVASATVEQLRSGEGPAQECPGGYKEAAQRMKPGLVVYCFKFVEPGQTSGMAWDGLIHVNGHWAIFPKPWRALK